MIEQVNCSDIICLCRLKGPIWNKILMNLQFLTLSIVVDLECGVNEI